MPTATISWKGHKAKLELHLKITGRVDTEGVVVQAFSQDLNTEAELSNKATERVD